MRKAWQIVPVQPDGQGMAIGAVLEYPDTVLSATLGRARGALAHHAEPAIVMLVVSDATVFGGYIRHADKRDLMDRAFRVIVRMGAGELRYWTNLATECGHKLALAETPQLRLMDDEPTDGEHR